MPKDRLQELQRKCGTKFEDETLNSSKPIESVLSNFFTKLEIIHNGIDKLDEDVDRIGRKYIDDVTLPFVNQDQRKRNDDFAVSILENAKNIRQQLNAIEYDIEANSKTSLLMGSAEERIKQHQLSSSSKRFSSIMLDFINKQKDYTESCKKSIRNNLKVAGKDISEEKLEDCLKYSSLNVFAEDFVTQTEASKRMLSEIEIRHQEIIKLEQNLLELKDIFNSMNFIIERQGEIVDRIDIAVGSAANRVEEAKCQLFKGRSQRNSSRCKKMICFVSLGFLVLILCVSVFSALGSFR